MPKRKVISESGKTQTKKLKGDESSGKTTQSQLSFESPRQCLQSMIYPKTVEEFFENCWEKDHLFIQRKNDKYYGDICTKNDLLEIVKKGELVYDLDLFVSKYSKDNEDDVVDAEGKATVKSLKEYFDNKKASVMLSRPHRFNKEIETMLQLLEIYFGSCAYAHVEVTPAGSQGHAPCYVGREVFNLQLEGKKCWRLYNPVIKLATEDSLDLDESELGDVLHECILEPGDLLYLPRGTVFQAASLDEYSTDLSVELYEENSWGKFLSSIIERAITKATENDVVLREGLPINYLSYMGFSKNEKNSELLGSNGDINSAFRKLVPKLDKSVLEKQQSFEEKLKKMFISLTQYLDPHWGADYLGTSFMGNRLAPTLSEKEANNKVPDENSLVQMTHPEHVRIIFSKPGDELNQEDDDDEDEDDDEEEEEEDGEENGKEIKGKSEEKDKDEDKKKSKAESKKVKEDKIPKGKQGAEKKTKKSSTSSKKEKDGKDNEDEEMEEGSEDLDKTFDGKPCIVVQHSLQNDVNNDVQMMPGILEFPVHFSDALLVLHRSTKPVPLKDLPLTDEERVELGYSLWCEGLLEVKDAT